MKRIVAAIAVVVAIIVVLTYLLDGTGILSGTAGMFVRVLIGFTLLFVSIQLAVFSDRGRDEADQR